MKLIACTKLGVVLLSRDKGIGALPAPSPPCPTGYDRLELSINWFAVQNYIEGPERMINFGLGFLVNAAKFER